MGLPWFGLKRSDYDFHHLTDSNFCQSCLPVIKLIYFYCFLFCILEIILVSQRLGKQRLTRKKKKEHCQEERKFYKGPCPPYECFELQITDLS